MLLSDKELPDPWALDLPNTNEGLFSYNVMQHPANLIRYKTTRYGMKPCIHDMISHDEKISWLLFNLLLRSLYGTSTLYGIFLKAYTSRMSNFDW